MKRRLTDLKADWPLYLRTLRRREIGMIFGRCPQNTFSCGLELGAGDGFQSTLLAPYVCRLIATDYRPVIMLSDQAGGTHPTGGQPSGAVDESSRVSRLICDAEQVDEVFQSFQFDLIFSSNMLEHLPDPGRALRGMRSVLADDGIAVHIIPSPFWKLCHVGGFYINAILARLDRRLRAGRLANNSLTSQGGGAEWDNNPKISGSRRPYLARLLWPAAHGASGSNLKEFVLFSRRYWNAQFAAAGFRVAATHRGPVSSGYGFGWDAARALLERLGLSSETIYVTVKSGRPQPDRLRYFCD